MINALAALLLAVAPMPQQAEAATTELRIKSAVMVRGLDVKVGDLCVITPLNASTQAIAQMRFGPAPSNGFSRTVSRTDLVQALAAGGVPLTTVRIAGVDEVVVQGLARDVPQADMLDAATAALQAQLAVEGGDVEFEAPNGFRRVKAPPGRISQDLRARVRNTNTNSSSAVVDVEILVDGELFKKVPLRFRLTRFHRVLKTVGAIPENTPLGPENVALVREPTAQLSGMYLTEMKQVVGRIAARRLRTNQLLTLGDIEPPAVIQKGDVVTVVLTRGRVKVTAKALANHSAPLGARIRLTNMTSRSQITGVVHAPGLVVVAN
ncbi:MAG: flagellar basal body P-ring formation chaperone FlgA [Planctomycetota bacterium]